jgi:hypothetical protein
MHNYGCTSHKTAPPVLVDGVPVLRQDRTSAPDMLTAAPASPPSTIQKLLTPLSGSF